MMVQLEHSVTTATPLLLHDPATNESNWKENDGECYSTTCELIPDHSNLVVHANCFLPGVELSCVAHQT